MPGHNFWGSEKKKENEQQKQNNNKRKKEKKGRNKYVDNPFFVIQ